MTRWKTRLNAPHVAWAAAAVPWQRQFSLQAVRVVAELYTGSGAAAVRYNAGVHPIHDAWSHAVPTRARRIAVCGCYRDVDKIPTSTESSQTQFLHLTCTFERFVVPCSCLYIIY